MPSKSTKIVSPKSHAVIVEGIEPKQKEVKKENRKG